MSCAVISPLAMHPVHLDDLPPLRPNSRHMSIAAGATTTTTTTDPAFKPAPVRRAATISAGGPRRQQRQSIFLETGLLEEEPALSIDKVQRRESVMVSAMIVAAAATTTTTTMTSSETSTRRVTASIPRPASSYIPMSTHLNTTVPLTRPQSSGLALDTSLHVAKTRNEAARQSWAPASALEFSSTTTRRPQTPLSPRSSPGSSPGSSPCCPPVHQMPTPARLSPVSVSSVATDASSVSAWSNWSSGTGSTVFTNASSLSAAAGGSSTVTTTITTGIRVAPRKRAWYSKLGDATWRQWQPANNANTTTRTNGTATTTQTAWKTRTFSLPLNSFEYSDDDNNSNNSNSSNSTSSNKPGRYVAAARRVADVVRPGTSRGSGERQTATFSVPRAQTDLGYYGRNSSNSNSRARPHSMMLLQPSSKMLGGNAMRRLQKPTRLQPQVQYGFPYK